MQKEIFERLTLWLAGLLFVGLLLPNHYSPWLSVHQELAAAIAFSPLIAFAAIQHARLPPLAIGAFLFALVPLIQIATARLVFTTDAWLASLYLSAFALAVHAGAQWVGGLTAETSVRLDFLVSLWVALLLAAIVSSGLALHQWLLPSDGGISVVEMPPGGRPFANLAQPNHLATLLLMGLCGLMFVWETRHVRTVLAGAVASCLIFGLAMTGSRSVLLALSWWIPMYVVLRKRCKLRMSPSAFISCALLYLFFGWLWPLLSDLLLLRMPAEVAINRTGGSSERLIMWSQMLDAITRHPWVGWGWGQITMAQTATALEHPAIHTSFTSGHNLFLDIALWAGVPVALACFVGLAWWAWQTVRQIRDPLAWICLVGIGIVFSHSMVEYPLYYAYFMLPVAILMGALSWRIVPSVTKVKASSFRGRRFFTMAVVAVSGALFVRVTLEYFPFEADWQLMRFQEARIGSLEATEPPPAFILTSLHSFLHWSRVKPVPGMSTADIKHMRDVSERYAYAAPMYRLALAQALNGQGDLARETLARLCRMQSKRACESARRDWEEKAADEYPQLGALEFPPSP